MAKQPQEERICLSTLKSRGWTDSLIKKHLPEPMLVTNPHYTRAPEMKLWYLSEIERIEKEVDEFQQRKEKLAKKNAAKEMRRQEAIRQKEERIARFTSELNVRNPALDYPLARNMARHFILNVGDTNTGKTYQALQALKAAETGVYLAPLRLLAMEVQDRLLDEGVLCSMVTGEEENLVEDAQIMSSTVEKIDLTKIYEVGVIDECQMIADDARGGSWTRAILGLAAETIYLCMSPDAENICKKLIDMCGDTYEVHKCTRNTELIFEGKTDERFLQRNDAVILFSRKKVLAFAEMVKQKYKLTPSVVYGALPYKARKQQVELYNEGKTDIIIATDAIGMGMNLPIKRVVFAETEKFDGVARRPLYASEVKQIAGRAGRRGIFEKGYVAAFQQANTINDKLKAKNRIIQKAHVPFPHDALKHSSEPLSVVLNEWAQVQYPEIFTQQNIELMAEKAEYLEENYPMLRREEMLKLTMVMFDEKDEELYGLWERYVQFYVSGIEIRMPKPNEVCYNLQVNEHSYKELDLYYSFHKTMELDFDYDELMSRKEALVEMINKCLLETNKKLKKKKKNIQNTPRKRDKRRRVH